MRIWLASVASQGCRIGKIVAGAVAVIALTTCAFGQSSSEVGGEANLKLPDLSQVNFLGMDGHRLLLIGILFCIFGLGFGLVIYTRLKNLPVHRAMREISELIYETCKTYLITQGKFLLLLWAFIAVIIVLYFGVLLKYEAVRVIVILLFSVVGIAGSYGVAWFGGFAIGESLGAAALRIAGGIFTKIADIGSDLMKIVFKIKEDDARNPGVIADCTGDNAGDSVGPSADGFETYGVTGVALITFILLG